MAIAYKSAGSGAGTETSGASLDLACPATVDANDVLIAHVTWLDITNSPSTPSGWTLLYGPANLGTGTAVGRSWVFGKLAAGTEDGATIGFGTAGGTSGRYGRIYSFSGYSSGTITEIVLGFSDIPTEGSIPLPTVSTTVAGALAVALLTQDDNNAFAAATGEVGGSWTEPVAEFVSTTIGAQGCITGIQVCTPTADPGTVIFGTANATVDEGSSIGFQITPAPITTGVVSVVTVGDPWTGDAMTEDSPSIAVEDGDLILVGLAKADQESQTNITFSTLSGSTTAWTEHHDHRAASDVQLNVSSCEATATGNVVVRKVNTGGTATIDAGWFVMVIRGHGGIGNVASGAGKTVNLTTSDGSTVVAINADWSATSPAGTLTPAADYTIVETLITGNYAIHAGVWTPVAAGTVAYGSTGGGGTDYRVCAIEILAAAGGTTIPLGLPETTDAALAVTKAVVRTLGLPSTTDAALAVTTAVTRTLDLPTTTDEALALTKAVSRTLGQPSTTDEPLALTKTEVHTLGLVETTDEALAITKVVGWTLTLGLPETTDTALPITKAVVRTLGLLETTDAPLAVTTVVTRALGLPTTTDETQALTRTLSRSLGLPSTTDEALAVSKAVVRTLGLPETTDTPLAITKSSGATVIVLGQPETTDTALAISKAVVRTLGLVTVTEEPLAITRNVTRVLGLPTTTDTALGLTRTLARSLGLPETTDAALAIAKLADRVIVLGLPETFDITYTLSVVITMERWTFSPPHRGAYVPDWIRGVSPRKAKTPFDHFAPTIERRPNVFLLTDDTLTEEQPPSWSQVAKVYYGGHVAVIEDQAERDRLVAAGYDVQPVP